MSKGRGLAALALQTYPNLYDEPLLAACVENLQFDRQCEENRASYVMRLLELAGLKPQALETILAHFPAAEEGWDRDLMIDLLGALAEGGDTQALEALREIAAGGDERAQNRLAESGETGLQWIVDHVLPSLKEEDRWRIGMWLPDEPTDDVTPLQRDLRKLDDERMASLPSMRRPKSRASSAKPSFLRDIRRNKASYVDAIEFARTASPSQWRAAARLFLREPDSRPLRVLARAFRERPFPLPVARLFRQADHPERGGAVMRVLGALDTPVVRRFALGLVRRRPLVWSSLTALRSVIRPGDERLMLEALRSTQNEDNVTRHDPILDVVDFMRSRPKMAWQPHVEWIFQHSPCSVCRGSAAEWMIEYGDLPASFLAEMPFDAESDIREAAAKIR